MSDWVVNIKDNPHFDVKIMRPGKWGNPFILGRDGDRDEVLAKYRKWLDAHPYMKDAARRELKGMVLGCCCKPLACHGDVLAEIANAEVGVSP